MATEQGEVVYVGRPTDTKTDQVADWARKEIAAANGDRSEVIGRGESMPTVYIEGDPWSLAYWDETDRDAVAWDQLTLGEDVLPGIWEIDSGECAVKLDKKKTKKKDSAKSEDLGLEPAKFTARGILNAREDWRSLQRIFNKLNPRGHGERKPLKIYHPAVAFIGVDTVYIQRVRAPQLKQGVLEVGVDLLEWTQKPKTTKAIKTPAARDSTMSLKQQQALANAMATPVEQWYGHAVHVGPTPPNVADAAEQKRRAALDPRFREGQPQAAPSTGYVQPGEFTKAKP